MSALQQDRLAARIDPAERQEPYWLIITTLYSGSVNVAHIPFDIKSAALAAKIEWTKLRDEHHPKLGFTIMVVPRG